MAKHGFSVTFERFLPHDDGEEICEADESGFVVESVTLREALGEIAMRPQWARASANEWPIVAPRRFTFDKWNDCTRENIEQGIDENRALHVPDHITDASRRRLARFL